MTFSPSFKVAVRDRGQLKMLNRPKRDTEGYKMEGWRREPQMGQPCWGRCAPPPHTHTEDRVWGCAEEELGSLKG